MDGVVFDAEEEDAGAPKEKAGLAGWLVVEAELPNPPNPLVLLFVADASEVCEGVPKLKVGLFSLLEGCEGAPNVNGDDFFSSLLPLAGAPKLNVPGEEIDATGAGLAAAAPNPVDPRFA